MIPLLRTLFSKIKKGGDSFVHSANPNLICPDTSCSAFHGLYNASKVRRQ